MNWSERLVLAFHAVLILGLLLAIGSLTADLAVLLSISLIIAIIIFRPVLKVSRLFQRT
ncbi:MAG TPA: hypothetical protein VFG56_00735 [Candidatus Saccharimonadales bacterium]|nr:hypothetical protein [Candidatus Saccharimonadales bacterium]